MHLANFITRFNEGDAIGNFMAYAKWKRLCFIFTSVWLSVANLSFSSKSFALNTKVLNYHALSYFKELGVLYYLFRALPLWGFFLNWHSLQLSVSSLEPAWSWDLQFGLDQLTPNDSIVSPSSPPLSLYNAACHKPLSTPQMCVLSCFLSFCAFLFCHLFPFPQCRSQQMSIVWFCWRSLH